MRFWHVIGLFILIFAILFKVKYNYEYHFETNDGCNGEKQFNSQSQSQGTHIVLRDVWKKVFASLINTKEA